MKKRFLFVTIFLLISIISIVSASDSNTNLSQDQVIQETTVSAPIIKAEEVQKNANYVWTLLGAFLVFFMQAGFAMVETGLTRAKNASNIMMKNLMDFVIGTLAFYLIGFGLMFGNNPTGFYGTDGFLLSDFAKDKDLWLYAFWIFQVVFAATSATIVSGAMAERTKFTAYLIYSLVISIFIYPVFGSWCWSGLYHGKGWLEKMGFIDFAGSTVVHSIGGWASLAGAIVVGPRIGKFGSDGKPKAIPGHSITLASLGVFILWFGWFGFNPGSTTVAGGDAAKIAVNTNLAGAGGGLSAMITAWILFKKPEATMSLNGVLAGLVAITAGCNNVTPLSSIIIGLLAGILVVISVIFIERFLKIDDPVGAISVHGVCGAFGTLCVAIFNEAGFSLNLLYVQSLGVICAFIWSFVLCFVMFKIISSTIGLRVSKDEEIEGLDITEHGNIAYPDFVQAEK